MSILCECCFRFVDNPAKYDRCTACRPKEKKDLSLRAYEEYAISTDKPLKYGQWVADNSK